MKYREIPPLEKPISLIAQGTMMLKKEMAEDGYAILDAAFEAGVNFYDAAHIYGGGDCERVFGEWARKRGRVVTGGRRWRNMPAKRAQTRTCITVGWII